MMNAGVQSVKCGTVLYKDTATGEEHSLETDAILLATGRRPHTSGLNLVAMAMKTGQDYTFLRDFIFTHPSMVEAMNDLMNI